MLYLAAERVQPGASIPRQIRTPSCSSETANTNVPCVVDCLAWPHRHKHPGAWYERMSACENSFVKTRINLSFYTALHWDLLPLLVSFSSKPTKTERKPLSRMKMLKFYHNLFAVKLCWSKKKIIIIILTKKLKPGECSNISLRDPSFLAPKPNNS